MQFFISEFSHLVLSSWQMLELIIIVTSSCSFKKFLITSLLVFCVFGFSSSVLAAASWQQLTIGSNLACKV